MISKKLLVAGAVVVLTAVLFAGYNIVSEETDDASTVTPGSTITFTYHHLSDYEEGPIFASEGSAVDSIFGWTTYLEKVSNTASTITFRVPLDAKNGTYQFTETLWNDEACEEMDYYSQSFTVTGQKGTSSSNPYNGPIHPYGNNSVGPWQTATNTVYVQAGSEIDMRVWWWLRSDENHSYSVTAGSGVESSLTANGDYLRFTGNVNRDCTISMTSSDSTGRVNNLNYVFKTVGSVQTYTHTVVYNANGGSGSMANTIVTDQRSGSTYVKLNQDCAFTKSGYVFNGWSFSSSATSGIIEGTYIAGNASTTAYATWIPVSQAVSISNAKVNQSYTYFKDVYPSHSSAWDGGDSIGYTVFATGLPAGMSLELTDYSNNWEYYGFRIVGTPTVAGTYYVNFLLSTNHFDWDLYEQEELFEAYSGTERYFYKLVVEPDTVDMTIGSVAKQYAVAGKTISFGAASNAATAGKAVTYTVSNVPSGLSVNVNGSTVTCSSSAVGTYTFTLTASASGYTTASTTVTVQFVPALAFTNTPSAGALNA